MKTLICILIACAASVYARDLTPLNARVSRVDGDKGSIAYRIDYDTPYEATLGVTKGRILRQRMVTFYDKGILMGSYYYWQDVGSGMPSAVTAKDLLTKPDRFDRVRIRDYFYDVSWRDGRMSEEFIGKWFTQTWHLFNSCTPSDSRYHLCKIDDIPRMDGYLEGAGFTVYAVLSHSFDLNVEAGSQGRSSPKRTVPGQAADRPKSK